MKIGQWFALNEVQQEYTHRLTQRQSVSSKYTHHQEETSQIFHFSSLLLLYNKNRDTIVNAWS